MGGKGFFGKGVHAKFVRANLPAHTEIRIRMKFYAVASWDNEVFYTAADGKIVYAKKSWWKKTNVGNLCGSSWADNFYTVDVTFKHSSQFLALDFWSTIN